MIKMLVYQSHFTNKPYRNSLVLSRDYRIGLGLSPVRMVIIYNFSLIQKNVVQNLYFRTNFCFENLQNNDFISATSIQPSNFLTKSESLKTDFETQITIICERLNQFK